MDRYRQSEHLAVVSQKDSDGLYVLGVLESRKEKVLHFHTKKNEKDNPGQNSSKKTEALWLNLMGHGHQEAIERIMKSKICRMAVNSDGKHTKCDTCTRTKETKTTAPREPDRRVSQSHCSHGRMWTC